MASAYTPQKPRLKEEYINLLLKRFTYERVKEVKVFPLSIIFVFEGDTVNYRFNSH
jgi:hypothetical protein